MRLALISDIHGNDHALGAVLADIDAYGVDSIACLGDVATLGPRPLEALARVGERADIRIAGNHDAYLLEPTLIEGYTEVAVVRDAVDWCREKLGASERELLARFEPTHRSQLTEHHALLMFHGSPRDHSENLLDVTPPDLLDEALAGHAATHYAGGHTHLPLLRQHGDALLINPGSVGLAFREFAAGGAPVVLDHADYAVIEVQGTVVTTTHRRVPLDRDALRIAADVPEFPLRDFLVAAYR